MKNRFALASLTFLVLVFLLGGSSSQGIAGNALIQFLAVPLIVWEVILHRRAEIPQQVSPSLLWVWIAAAALALVQFIPLPAGVWTALPGRSEVAHGFELLGMDLPVQTASMSPWDSLASLTWCLPAIALFLAARSGRGPTARSSAGVLVALAGLSVAVGITQRVSGNLYFYPTTNYGTPVGFFSNVNHQATFLICALLFWVAYSALADRGKTRKHDRTVFYYGVGLYLVLGVILCGSLAGTGLLILAVALSVLILKQQWRLSRTVLLGLVVVGVAGAVAYGFSGLSLTGFVLDTQQPGMSRSDFWRNGLVMARSYAPLGSGLGTFEQVYHLFEDTGNLTTTFVNHAHNDYLELIIEGGIFGVALIVAFLVWLVRRSLLALRDRSDPASLAIVMVVIILSLHSLVDYPLRTAALSSVFGFAAGLLVRPREVRQTSQRGRLTTLQPSLI